MALALLVLAESASAFNATQRRVNVSTLEIAASFPPENVSLYEGDDFKISSNVTCYFDTCSFVKIYPLYCTASNCSSFNATFSPMETDSTYPIYSKNNLPYKCLYVEKGRGCSTNWTIRVKHTGIYKVAIMAAAANAKTVYSNVSTVTVRGCGDGNCSGNETYSGCPRDCCEPDCTATYDRICHKACNDHNGCSMAVGCDGEKVGFRSCMSANSLIECCGAGVTNCGLAAYCADAYCRNCSYVCDGACDAAACYGIDPDCDRNGSASAPCCGNNRLDPGEACDGDVRGACENGCRGNCTCVVTTTTTTSTTTTTTTTTSTTSTTSTTTTSTTTTSTATTTAPEESPAVNLFSGMEPLIFAAFILIATAVAVAYYLHARGEKKKATKEYEDAKDKEAALVKSIKEIKAKYAAHKISMKEATDMILSHEKELESHRQKMDALGRRLGIKK